MVIYCILHSEALLPFQKIPVACFASAAHQCEQQCKRYLDAKDIVHLFERYHVIFKLLHIWLVFLFGGCKCFNVPEHKVAILQSSPKSLSFNTTFMGFACIRSMCCYLLLNDDFNISKTSIPLNIPFSPVRLTFFQAIFQKWICYCK